jgi:hypothetical protein
MRLSEITAQLEEPFALEDIDFLPKGAFEKNGNTFCMGLPFADKRVYEDRLNVVCPDEWATQASVTVAADRIVTVVTVTICGIPHTDVGEAFLVKSNGKREENPATESYAQGFKRACSQARIGRFLYALGKVYLPFDKQDNKILLDANALRAEARKLYVKAGLIESTPRRQQASLSAGLPPEPEHGQIATPTVSTPLSPEVGSLKSHAVDLGIIHTKADWVTYKQRVLGTQVRDGALTDQHIATLRAAMDIDKQQKKTS